MKAFSFPSSTGMIGSLHRHPPLTASGARLGLPGHCDFNIGDVGVQHLLKSVAFGRLPSLWKSDIKMLRCRAQGDRGP
ncbi:hypothetical protein [Cupriavidus campinensis]